MKIQIKKIIFYLIAVTILFSSNSVAFAASGFKSEVNIKNIDTTTTTTNITDSTNNDFTVSARQSTIVGDYNKAYIDVLVTENKHLNADRNIENIKAYVSIENPISVHIANDGVFSLRGPNDSFRIPLYTIDTDEDRTIPINIKLKYDVETTPSISTTIEDPINEKKKEIDFKDKTSTTTITTGSRTDSSTNKTYESKELTTTIYVTHLAKQFPKNSMIEVEKFEILPNNNITPGSEFEVAFTLKNPGDAPANNVKLSLEGLDAKGINMARGLSTVDTTTLNPGDIRLISYSLKIPASARGGQYPLSLKYSFTGKNPKGEDTQAPITGEYTFSIDVKQADMAPSTLIFDRVDFPTGRLGKNESVKISFSLKNIGTKNAQNIKISAISQDVEGLMPVSGSNAIVPALKPGQVESYTFEFKTANAISTKTYPVEITVEYLDDASGEEAHKITQIVGINGVDWFAEAQKLKDGPKSTPILIIEKYEFNPELIFAGTQFTMKMDIRNTHSSKTIKNIKISMTSDIKQSADQSAPSATASVFTPVQSSNTFYIDHIAPGEVIEKTVTMTTAHDTAAKTYTLTANLEYEDSQANPYKSEEIIGIPIVQDSKLSIGEIHLDPEYYLGTPGSLNVEFYNTGKVTLSNFMVEFEGESLMVDMPTYYKGNFPSGTSDSYSITITPESLDAKDGMLIFSYEDTTGEKHTIEKDFKITVNEMNPMDFAYEELPLEPPKTANWPLRIGIAIAALGFTGGVFYKLRKKKKEEEDLFLDED